MLATIDGRPIRADDLMPLAEGQTEAQMTEAEYHSRLTRAIEAELTFGAAKAHGIELDAAQKTRLDQIRSRHAKDLDSLRAKGITRSSAGANAVELQVKMVSAPMLQESLVASEGGARPSPDPAVQARYEAERTALLKRLRSNAKVDVTAEP